MRTPRLFIALLAAAVSVASAGCAGDDSPTTKNEKAGGAAKTSVAITAPKSGATIAGNVVSLELDLSGIELVKADGDTSGKTGHFHVFVDQEPVAVGEVIPKAANIIHSADNPVVIPGLTAGKHELTVVVGDGTHKRLDVEADTATVTVEGPTLDASAPATLAAGAPLSIDVAVGGFDLVKADGATGEATGHLHAFVDVAPAAPGEAIATGNPAIIHSATSPITVSGLAPGEHTIWIVAGDGTHHAFMSNVRDKVVVTVS